jgi:signal peptidase II
MQAQSYMKTSGERISHRSLAIAAVVVPIVITLDQLTKRLIWNTHGPAGDRLESDWLGGLLRLHFVRNTGSAFGMFQGQSGVLTVATFFAIAFLALFFVRNARRDPVVALALGLLIGGALGNLIDRIRLGYVIDWIKLPNWPTFNVADSAITVGVALLFFAILFRSTSDEPAVRDEASAPPGAPSLRSVNED